MRLKSFFAGIATTVALGVIACAQPAQAWYYNNYYSWYRAPLWPRMMAPLLYSGYNPLYWVGAAAYSLSNPYRYGYGYGGYGYGNPYGQAYAPQYMMPPQYQYQQSAYAPPVVVISPRRQMPLVIDQSNPQWQTQVPASNQQVVSPPGNYAEPVQTREVDEETVAAQPSKKSKSSQAAKFVALVNQKHQGDMSQALFDPEARTLARQCGLITSDDIFDADFTSDRLSLMRGILQDRSLSPEVRVQTIGVLLKHQSQSESLATRGPAATGWQ